MRKFSSESSQVDGEQIARLAYFLWEQDGWPDDRDQEHWYEAQARLKLDPLHTAKMFAATARLLMAARDTNKRLPGEVRR